MEESKSDLYIVAIIGVIAIVSLVILVLNVGVNSVSSDQTGAVMLVPVEEEYQGDVVYNYGAIYSCVDTDPTNDIYVAGTTTITERQTGRIINSYPDACFCNMRKCVIYQISCDATSSTGAKLTSSACPSITADGGVFPGGFCENTNRCMKQPGVNSPLVKTDMILAGDTTTSME
jgi:hypothetical protein